MGTVQTRLMHEAGGRIDGARGTDGDEEIALGQGRIDAIQPQRHLAKPDHMGPQRLGQLAAGAELVLVKIPAPFDHLARPRAAGLEQLPVHVDEILAAGALVQVVDVLGDQGHASRQQALEAGQGIVGRVGMDLVPLQLMASRVVEALHQFGIPCIALRGGYIFHPVLLPQAVAGPERLDTGLGRDAGTGEDHDMFG